MSKNKNPLKDINQFLKQEATSLVNPTSLGEKISSETFPLSAGVTETVQKEPVAGEDVLVDKLHRLSRENPSEFYNLVLKAAENTSSPENKMLINTLLFIQHGSNWKDAIRQYWKTR